MSPQNQSLMSVSGTAVHGVCDPKLHSQGLAYGGRDDVIAGSGVCITGLRHERTVVWDGGTGRTPSCPDPTRPLEFEAVVG